MEFRIADTFTASLARLTGAEQKAVKTTAFDLQMDPSAPGLSFHKLDRARDKNFWSVRVSQDIRLIVHRTGESLLLCYVDHHDRAYDWAERRKLETHPKTGAAQLVEIRERVQQIPLRPQHSFTPPTGSISSDSPQLFARQTDAELLGFGVPAEWLSDVRQATEDSLLHLAEHLPAEAAEALLELATGGVPKAAAPAGAGPFEHPDAQRRFRIVSGIEELQQALEFPWDRWTVFLHPDQRDLVQRTFSGPARVAGTAGTGKTVVAIHRAAHLARRNPEARVLLTTFSDTLANALRTKLARLIGGEPRVNERIDVASLAAVASRLHERLIGPVTPASDADVRAVVAEISSGATQALSPRFLAEEWREVVDAWALGSWEAYRDVPRLGRKTRLPEKRREQAWAVLERVSAQLRDRNLTTAAQQYYRVIARLRSDVTSPYDHVVVDEAQDLSVAQLRFVAALGGDRPDALFFAGDLGQRIFQLPFSWRSLGIDIRGRSERLKVNYRTSHQIRVQADRLLGESLSDADDNVEARAGTISVFNSADPTIRTFKDERDELNAVATWLTERTREGVLAGEMGIFVRSDAEIARAVRAVETAGLAGVLLDDQVQPSRDRVAIGQMHLSKGLEFRAVVVMACDDEVLPLQSRIEAVADDGDLQDVYETERHLLYVACTRARDHLLVTGVEPGSEFLEDMGGSGSRGSVH